MLAGVKRIKNTRNEEISTSTFQKHILLLWTDLYKKSYNAAKTVGEEGKSEDDLIRKNGDIPFKVRKPEIGEGFFIILKI